MSDLDIALAYVSFIISVILFELIREVIKTKYIDADRQEEIMRENDKDYDNYVCVVRCKDCKFYHNELANSPKRGTYLCERLRAYTEKEDFCCWGKTK